VGDLVLGIDERKSRPRVATVIDGVSTAVAPERLQQLIEGNLSPYLPGCIGILNHLFFWPEL
jgi:hypothetical protein